MLNRRGYVKKNKVKARLKVGFMISIGLDELLAVSISIYIYIHICITVSNLFILAVDLSSKQTYEKEVSQVLFMTVVGLN